MAAGLVRTALTLGIIVCALALIAFHGIRAIGVLVAVGLLLSVPRTQAFRQVERVLVRITGSRRRAAVVAAVVVIGAALAYNIVEFLR